MKKLFTIILFINRKSKTFLQFFFFLLVTTHVSGQQLKLNIDYSNSEVRSKRVKLALEVNKGIDFSGAIKISFGADVNSLSTQTIDSVLDSEDYNLKTYYFEQEDLAPNTTYVYKWYLETEELGNFETEFVQITTPSSFDVLPYQLFEIPEEGIIPGDTIGYIKYEDTDGSWKKIKTYYKTTLGLKTDGTLWAWGRNAKKLVVNPSSQSEVVYEPIQISKPPDPGEIDLDGDGFWDIDEEDYGNSDPNDPESVPVDSDGDFFSDALENFIGMDPNNGNITWEEDQKLFEFFLENFSDPDNALKFHDFELSRTSVLAIEEQTRHLWFWGVGMGNSNLDRREYDLDQSHPNPDDPNGGFYFPNGYTSDVNDNSLPPFNFAIADMSTGYESIFEYPYVIDSLKTWDKVSMSNNYATPKFKNLNNLGEIYDTTVAGITTDGDLFIWGIVDGLLLPDYIQVGVDRKWVDVKVGDAIIALANDGTIHEIGMDIPLDANNSTLDKDNDGVPDATDAFEWDPNYQYDSDDDGFPDKAEDQRGTDKNNPDTDGDGVTDAEDQLPLDPNYSKDSDFDGLPDELDPNDDNWDSDGDGTADGDDADPLDPTKKWDCDGDGLSDEDEWEQFSDPCVLDTDGDGVDDKDDKYPRTFYYQYDSDEDGLPDALEALNETDPNNPDTDGDGYLDAIAASKFDYFRQLANDLDCSQGWDRCDQWQYFWRFWDIKYDCDGNGWVSWEEWEGIDPACQSIQPRDDFPTDPNANLDSDRDGDPDNTDPDDDNDGFEDVVELNQNVNTDPLDWESQPVDSDGDRLPDGIEKELGTDPFNWDSDGDFSGDGWDAWPLDPKLSWDDDKDKLENWVEMAFLNTDPNNSDTDGDGVDDFLDAFPTDPDSSKDSDGDGLSDSYEDANGLNKNSMDSDGDGYYDAPCNRDKMVLFTDDYGNSWYEPNWRECEGSWEEISSGNWEFSPSTWIEDEFPTIPDEYKDTDGDGTGDNADTDDDNDGYLDDNDDFPFDSTEWLNTDKPTIANGYLKDYDEDGIYGEDTNNDGWVDEVGGDWRRFDFIGNNKDPDDDGDLFLDVDEIANGTDPLDKDDYPQGDVDPDQDGFSNLYESIRETDPNNWDSDGDGVSDGWQYPNHSTNYTWQSGDTWEDSFFRDRDPDTCCSWYYFNNGELVGDGEGELFIDQFPNDANEYWDTDGDTIPDNLDTDDDNDGLTDIYETTVKRSGWDWTTSNPYKKDTDGDGIEDGEDAIPWYDRESIDTDGDFQGDNEDIDDDGDGMWDSEEKELGLDPLNPDSDGDGWFDGDCNPNAVLIDDNGNWRHEISFTGSSTLVNEKYKFSIYFYDTWSNSELVYTTTATMTSVELVSAVADMFNENDFTSDGDPMTATASGSTLILVGEQDNAQHNIDMWYLQQNMLRARGNWCDWINKDKFPNNSEEWQDIDHDDIGDNEDTDDDNDGLSDEKEYALGTNPYYWDSDGDMFGDDWDKLPLDPTAFEDTDGDGIPDFTIEDTDGDGFLNPDIWGGPDTTTEVDLDLDGDGLSNEYEDENNLDKYQPDSDWDGYLDGEDVFPRRNDEWLDTDNDSIGNNFDTDDDNDKYSDKDEIFNGTDPLVSSSYPTDDLDQDFLSDLYEEELGTLITNQDTDDDGYLDGEDAFPTDATEWLDSDNDGEGNNSDFNDDNDHLNDFVEEFGIKEFGWNVDPLIHDDWDSLPYDNDWDGVPDEMENFLSNAASDAYFYGDDETKRKIYRAVKGLRNYENDDGDTFTGQEGNERPLENQDDEDADGNGILDHNETINFFDYNGNGVLNVDDSDSDGDGAPDGWDEAFLDSRGDRDYDNDLIHDWDDFDIDNDLILNNWERLYGTDRFNEDTDGDGIVDTYDFQGYDSRIQSKDDFSADLFNLNQIGTSSNWEYIETWNYGQSGASYAAINSDGELYVWGVNYGALPINDEKSQEAWENGENYGFVVPELTQARPNEKWKGISLGFKFGVGYSTDGTYYSWGRNLSSQLGNGKPTTYESFLEPSITLGEIIELDAGEQQVGVINKDGKLRMIGSNDQGQLGTGSTNDNTPQELDWEEIEGTIKEVKVTETETQILTTSNQIWAYGDNLYAQLGRGTRDTKAENYEAKKIDEEGWIEVFAISEHVYAFKSDGSLWAWGKNKNFDLGLGYKSEYVSTPTKVEGVDRNDIIDFSPLRGGFVYINTDGELWGAGTNFYTGSWFPLSSPRKIGNDTDWSHFHDFIGSELNILIEKTDGSIWGAGTNWSRVLTENPCPEAKNQINKISLTHPNSYQKTKIEIGEITGTATYSIKVNGTNLTTGSVSNSADLISETVRLFNADNTLTNNFTLTATPTNSGSSTLLFVSKNLVENSFSFSIKDKSDDFEGALSIIEVEDHVSGTATFTVNINGTRISAAAANVTDAVANLKTSFETSQNFSDQVNNYSFTTSGTSLLIENIGRESFFTTVEVINSSNSNATIETSSIQDRLDVNCWPRYLNNLVEIFPSGNSWDKIALGIKHAIGLDDNGLLYSWGQNDQLQLGLGSNKWDPKNTPTQITSTGTKTFIDIDASAEVSFAIDSDNNMYAWGDNDLGTLAVGDYSDKPYPTLVKGDINWKRNLGGYRFQVALDDNDKPYGWGYRKFGQLGALGKVKGDDIVWDTDLSEAQGTIETLNEGEYLIATQEFVNYLETLYNFESNDDSSSSKSNNIKGTVQKSPEFSSQKTKLDNRQPSTGKNVGKWKVKKSRSSYSGKSAISEDKQASDGGQNLTSQETPYSFTIVDVNEQPSDIILTDLQGKITQKADQFISSITVTDPDQDDILTVTIPSNSPNQDKFSVKNQKLYFNATTSKAKVPYQLILRATDWEGLILEKQFEVLVDEDGNILIEEQDTSSSDVGISYNEMFSDSDGDGFVDADEFLIGTDPFDFRSFPLDFDEDGILDFYDGDIDNDGYFNEDDQFPFNPAEWIDSDEDGIGDNLDIDDDNDGIPDIDVNWAENYIVQDLFPNDPNESTDFDRDGIGDNSDQDDDNDGYADTEDAFPYNPFEWLDSDNDSIGNNEDPDNDNDGFSDFDENAIGTNPLDPNDFPSDLDGDFVPDVIDFDRDGDGINNDFDNAPDLYNPSQEFADDENHIKLIFQEFFSPNGDGVNDNFEIGEIQRYPNNKIWIYDSVGNLVFEKQGYGNSWQGTSNGNPLPKGSYLYRVDADGNGITEYQGWIYLTR